MIPVAEIFGPTIQGEGPKVGIKTLFVRVVGCDFKCEWCDSKFAWKANENTKIYKEDDLIQELLMRCKETNTRNIVLTGGNPCLYDFDNVIRTLQKEGIDIDIETQGSILPEWLKGVDSLVISPKAPSSKQPDVYEGILEWFLSNKIYIPQITFKIPVFNDEDFKFAERYYELISIIKKQRNVNIKMYLSVGNTNTNEDKDITKRVLLDYEKLIDKTMNSDMQKVYILPQVHTLVWGNRQGV